MVVAEELTHSNLPILLFVGLGAGTGAFLRGELRARAAEKDE
jgi:hypothetical protein